MTASIIRAPARSDRKALELFIARRALEFEMRDTSIIEETQEINRMQQHKAIHAPEARRFTRSAAFRMLPIALLLTGIGCSHPQPPTERAEQLTVGKVQREITVGISAAEVAEILGSPNIVTTDEKRREVWIYDKISSDSVDTANSVGGGIIIFGASSKQRQSSKSQRTLTIIIKFDEEKKVRDFAYNSSQF